MVLRLILNQEQEWVSNIHVKKKHFKCVSIKTIEQYNSHMEMFAKFIEELLK